MHRNFKIAKTLLAAGMIAAAVAPAAGAAETRSVLVHTFDLDLASDSGRAALRQRVDHAVREACRVTGWGNTIAAERAYDACRTKALAGATLRADALVAAARTNHVAVNRDMPVSVR